MNKMNRSIKTLALLAAFTAIPSSILGITYDYSYEFSDGTVVSGTLDGTQNGNFVEGISNVSVSVNGTEVIASAYTAQWSGTGWTGVPIVSFDGSANNFLFRNGQSGFPYFHIVESRADLSHPFMVEALIPQNWSLSEATTSSPVPDGGSTAALLALGMAAMTYARRKP